MDSSQRTKQFIFYLGEELSTLNFALCRKMLKKMGTFVTEHFFGKMVDVS